MAGFCRRLRHHATRAAFAAVTAFPLAPSADAQWFPFGGAPPAEIVQRLQAEGYTLIRPLERRGTVYLADVAGGAGGHERLVLDAWSGEILQRFVARPGGFVPEGGEFSEPPPLGPPPAGDFREGPSPSRDFREGNYDYGPPEGPPAGVEAPPRARARPRPSATAHRGGEPKQTTPAAQPVEPRNARTGSPGAAPAAAAPMGAGAPATAASRAAAPANPTAAEPAKAETSPAAAASSPAAAQTQAKGGAQPAARATANPPASAEKPGGKKVNDVPVNPLD
jgi:hypothetical protein